MFVESFRVKNFRNLEHTEINPGRNVNLFLGNNAQGKTSLLESLFFSTNLKSFRTKTVLDCIKFNESAFQIDSHVCINETRNHFIKIRLGRDERRLELDEKPTTRSKFLGLLKAVEFSPESLMIIKEGPELRRDLIDDAAALFFQEAIQAQGTYIKVLKQRNAILSRLKREEISLSVAEDLLESINPQFISSATDVTFLRLQTMKQLLPEMQQNLAEIMGQNIELKTEYNESSNTVINTEHYNDIRDILLTTINDPKNKSKERAIGASYAGPHKHTLNIIYGGKNSRFFSSQGQQRALILAFKIAQIVYHKKTLGTHPILLLDDVLSEFDESKQKYLIDFLQSCNAQTFLTTTTYSQQLKRAKVFYLDSGKVRIDGT